MAMEKIGDGLKKILLVGIGAAATTVEKSSQIIDELVKKGEITVEQGKELNKELQHNVKKTMEARKLDAETIEAKLAKMSADEIELLKSKIREAEEAFADVTSDGSLKGDTLYKVETAGGTVRLQAVGFD